MNLLFLKICKLIKFLFKNHSHTVQTRGTYRIFTVARLAQINARITPFLNTYPTPISFAYSPSFTLNM